MQIMPYIYNGILCNNTVQELNLHVWKTERLTNTVLNLKKNIFMIYTHAINFEQCSKINKTVVCVGLWVAIME